MYDGRPAVTGVGRGINLPARRAEIDAAGIQLVDGHRVAQDVDVAIALRQTPGQGFPLIAAVAAAVDAQFAVGRVVLRVALDGHDVNGFRFVGMNVDDEAEIGRQIAAHLVPVVAGVVTAQDIPMLLHEQHVGIRRMEGDAMDTMADLGLGIGNVVGLKALVDRLPRLAAVIGAKRAGGRNGHEHTLRIPGIDEDGVQAHPPATGGPVGTGAMTTQPGQFFPCLPTVPGTKESGVFYSGKDHVGIGKRWLQMPDALELPRMGGIVVPLVSARLAFVLELISHGGPGLAAVVRAMHHLSEPVACLRSINSVRIEG